MRLSKEEELMLSGEYGSGAQKSMEILKAKGEAENARRMVKIDYAHLMPPDVMFFPYGRQGKWARELTGELTKGVTQLKVPTTMEPKFVDLDLAKDLEFSEDVIKEMRNIMIPASKFYENLGVIPSYTALPFTIFPTKIGQHVSIAESIAILWYNTIFGSRCERDDGVSSLAAAITGVYPEIGMHLTENRLGEVVIRPGRGVEPHRFTYADWDVYSLASSRKCKEKTPVFLDLPIDMSFTQLKHLLSVIAVESGLALMHIVGVTPEAPTFEAAFGCRKPLDEFIVSRNDLREAFEIADPAVSSKIDYVLLGCPHVTPTEFRIITEVLGNRKVCKDVKLIVSTSRSYLEIVEDMGYVNLIRRAGGMVTSDMCIAFSGTQVSGTIATDSIKAVFFYSGFSSEAKRNAHFGTIQECIEASITGTWGRRR